MNKRGQALIEFVLILPVLLLIIFAFIDFGRIIACKTHLEGVMNDVIEIKDEEKIDKYLKTDSTYRIKYSSHSSDVKVITLEVKLALITPGLKNILHNPYRVIVERSIL